MADAKVVNFYNTADIRGFSLERAEYLDAIDKEIIRLSSQNCTILDIGSGDGSRIKKIAEKLNSEVTTLDVSPIMSNLCRDLGFKAYCGDIVDFSLDEKFDVITCLWSVLGYVSDIPSALNRMSSMLSQNGSIFVDVNVRYNFSEYGLSNCSKNMLYDFLKINYSKKFPVKNSDCSVYLFDYWELDKMFLDRGLKFQKFYLNYKTGRKASLFTGQLLYVASHQ